MIFSIALKEVFGQRRFFAIIGINVILGLLGFSILEYFKDSVRNSIDAKSRGYLSADISVSSRVKLEDREVAVIDKFLQPGEKMATNMDVFSMVYVGNLSRLVTLKVLDEGFPFYGDFKMIGENRIYRAPEISSLLNDPSSVWVSRDVLTQLNLKVGDAVSIGKGSYLIKDVVLRDTGGQGGFAGLAPVIYMGHAAFAKADLLAAKGNTVTYRYLLQILNPEGVEGRVRALQKLLPNPAIRVLSHKTASEQTARALVYLSDYLGLASLTTLFLAGLGMFFLWRSYLQRRLNDFAIFRCLGMRTRQISTLVLTESSLVTFLALAVISVLSFGLSYSLAQLVKGLLPVDLSVRFSWRVPAMTFALGMLSQVLILLPLLRKYNQLRPNQLFSESAVKIMGWSLGDSMAYAPVIFTFWLFAVLISNSLVTGSGFFGLFAGTIAVIFVGSHFLLGLLERISSRWSEFAQFSVKQMTRQRLQSIILFVTMGLGISLVSFLFTLERNLQNDFQGPKRHELPNLFLVDIQPEQLPDLEKMVGESGGFLAQTSPFIVSRLLSVNGKDFEKMNIGENKSLSREEEEEVAFRNRGMNLSSRAKLADSERLVKGEWFPGPFNSAAQKLPFISVETEFAKRFGWKLGDVLDFDIQGVTVSAKILNFRQVKWNSFEPNFFISFQPGVIEEAPQTLISIIRGLKEDQIMDLQTQIVRKFSNISSIDVRTVSAQAVSIINQMAYAIQFMAFLSLTAGLGVFIAVILTQLRVRQSEVNLLKVLGLTAERIGWMIQREFGALLVGLSTIGAAAGVLLAYAVQKLFFTSEFVVPFLDLTVLVAGFLVICLIVVYLGFRQILKVRPQKLLRSI